MFAGWPSLKVGEKCAPPTTHNPAYQSGNCGENKIQCQPLLFGDGLCVDVATTKDRSLAFGRCQKSFAESGKTYDEVLDAVESANKEIELLALLDFADEACTTGYQASLYLCRRLEEVVSGIIKAQDGRDGSTAIDIVATAAGVAVNINETLHAAGVPPTNCQPETSGESNGVPVSMLGVYSPTQALADLNSGTLTFIGRELLAGSDQNRTCIYKSEKAFILYNNCMFSRREAPATDIEIISFNGDSIRFYVENNNVDAPISTLERAQYDSTWSVQYKQGQPLPAGSSLAQVQRYKENQVVDYSGACWIGEMGGASASAQGKCHGNKASVQSSWAQVSESFWRDPGPEWTTAKRMLIEKARTTPF